MLPFEETPIGLGDDLFLAKPIAIGTMQWGTTWLDQRLNKGGNLPDSVVDEILDEALQHGVQCFDTAEGYGGGSSEVRLRNRLVKSNRPQPHGLVIATKFLPTLWRWTQGSLLRAVRESNHRLGLPWCPLYFIHTPMHPLPLEFWVRSACAAADLHLIHSIGLSNCNAQQVERAQAEALRHGRRIAAHQVLYNLLDYNSAEVQEMEAVCQRHGIRIVAYSPIGQGLLTDGLTEAKFRGNRLTRIMGLQWDSSPDFFALRDTIARIAKAQGKTMAQVCLNWTICHGAIPLVGTRSGGQVRDSLGCLGWRLTSAEVAELDRHALARSTLSKPRWRRMAFVGLISLLLLSYRLTSFL